MVRRCFPDTSTQDVTIQGFYAHVEEDQIRDEERGHVAEKVSYFAIEPVTSGHIVSLATWEAAAEIDMAVSIAGSNAPEGSLVAPGEEIVVEVTLANNGPTIILPNEYVDLIMPLINGTTLVPDSFIYDDSIGLMYEYLGAVSWDGTLNPGESTVISYSLQIDQIGHGTVLNQTATWWYDSTGNGDEVFTATSFSLSVSNPSGEFSFLEANEGEIPADGVSTTTVRLTLNDINGDPVNDGFLRFETTAGTLVGAVSSPSAGIYEQQLQSAASLVEATVTAYVDGTFANPGERLLLDSTEPLSTTVDFVAGVPTCATSTITATPIVFSCEWL